MADITLVKQNPMQVSPEDRATVNRVLCGVVDGLGELGKKQWRLFLSGLLRLEPGEIVTVKTHKARSGRFHRRHMAIETAVFEAQEKFESFEQFRNWLKVGAGFCDWVAGPKGAVIPIPKSIAFDKLEDGEMRQVHHDMITFLRSEHACKVLWKHLDSQRRTDMIEAVFEGFEE
jgi:hypothetical protein